MKAGCSGSTCATRASSQARSAPSPAWPRSAYEMSLAWLNANSAVSSMTTMRRRCGSASASGRMRSTYSWSSAKNRTAPPSRIWYSTSCAEAVG